MAAGGFGPYHRLWSDDATSKRIGVTPTPWAMMPALGFVPCHWWRELWRTPPQQRICRLDFFGKKNRPKTMNMHLTATNPSSHPKNPPPITERAVSRCLVAGIRAPGSSSSPPAANMQQRDGRGCDG